MYWCAKPHGRVIEKARNIPAGYVFLALLLMLFNHTNAPTDLEVTANTPTSVYSFASEQGREVVMSSGMMVPLMDEDSFLGQISSEKFWGTKRKKKSRGVSAAQARKLSAASIEAARRSGVLTTRQGGGGFFGMFSGYESFLQPGYRKGLASHNGISTGGYRTLCVRLSDGYYWPISFAASRGRFRKDSRVCRQSCAEPVRLFVYRTSGGRPEDMVDLQGHRYNELENAWQYREEYVASRKCSAHPWEEASLAKHRAYALMANRLKAKSRRRVKFRGKRRLVRVGRLRTMSSVVSVVDGDFVKAGAIKTVARAGVLSGPRISTPLKRRRADKPSNKVVANVKRRRSARIGDVEKMRLGRKAADLKPARVMKRRRAARAKSNRRPRWAQEALGLD